MLYFFNVKTKMSLQSLAADGIFYTFRIVIPHLFSYQVKINEHPIK